MATTAVTYFDLDNAYEKLNARFFNGELPHVLITFQRSKRYKGYASLDRFIKRDDSGAKLDEVALNPDMFSRPDIQIMGTLLHEMCHIAEFHFHKPPRRGYHTQWWASKMEEVGLTPTDTGEAGGKKTGQKVSHIITPGGVYEQFYQDAFAGKRLWIEWKSVAVDTERQKKAEKTKYTCPSCGANVWGKPGMILICNCSDCDAEMEEQAKE